MIEKTIIHCPKCGEFLCYAEDLTYFVLFEDLKCKKCGTIVVSKGLYCYSGGVK